MKQGVDLRNQRFGKLIALENTNEKEDRYYLWRCRCDCGKEVLVSTRHLLRGTVRNCGCVPKEDARQGRQAEDLTGRQFGELTVLSRAENRGGRVYWNCRCSCGREKAISAASLKKGRTKSCGCKAHRKEPHPVDLTGYETGYLRVLERTDLRNQKKSMMWRCLCRRCGKEVLLSADVLKHGGIVSCGCYRKEEIQTHVHDRIHLVDGTCVEWLAGKRHRSDNTSGFRGVNQMKNGQYRASIGFKKRRYYIGSFDRYEDAVSARLEAERLIHHGFIESYSQWTAHANEDPAWGKENPHYFEVEQVQDHFVIYSK